MTSLTRAGLAAVLAAFILPAMAAAQAPVNFGNDASMWANDGECDDPRFEGEGMAMTLVESDRMRDASDCEALYEAGLIRLRAALSEFELGDDSSQFSFDGECDDPRFSGEGMAQYLMMADRMHDASDCGTLLRSGSIAYSGEVEFGNDMSQWARDNECDDPRFAGQGMAISREEANRMRDAADCRRLFEAGQIGLVGKIDFGDDSSQWANDGECDDPRFMGAAMAGTLRDEDMGRDATDCRTAFRSRLIYLR